MKRRNWTCKDFRDFEGFQDPVRPRGRTRRFAPPDSPWLFYWRASMNPIAPIEAQSSRRQTTTLAEPALDPAAQTPADLRSPRMSARRDSRTDLASTCRATGTHPRLPGLPESSVLPRRAGRCSSRFGVCSRNSPHTALYHDPSSTLPDRAGVSVTGSCRYARSVRSMNAGRTSMVSVNELRCHPDGVRTPTSHSPRVSDGEIVTRHSPLRVNWRCTRRTLRRISSAS
jgi:hypothetical protein